MSEVTFTGLQEGYRASGAPDTPPLPRTGPCEPL